MKPEHSDIVPVAGFGDSALPPRRLSTVLMALAREAKDSVTIEQIREALGDRSFATLLVFFAGLNLLPFPPGSTLILGIPLLLIAVQMVIGSRTAWLPRFVLAKSVSADKFRYMSEKLVPRLEWIERIIRPRYWPFDRSRADRVLGLAAFVMAIVVILPIPFGNWFPALSCALVGLALFERDGILLAIAFVCCLFSFALIGVVFGTAGALASMLFN